MTMIMIGLSDIAFFIFWFFFSVLYHLLTEFVLELPSFSYSVSMITKFTSLWKHRVYTIISVMHSLPLLPCQLSSVYIFQG